MADRLGNLQRGWRQENKGLNGIHKAYHPHSEFTQLLSSPLTNSPAHELTTGEVFIENGIDREVSHEYI